MTEREEFADWMHDKCPKGSRILTNLLAYRFGVIELEDVFKAGRASMYRDIMKEWDHSASMHGFEKRLKELGNE